MKEYHKIDTLFMREEFGKHKMIAGKYRSATIEQCKDLQWIFTEKVDGTNIRVYWDGHKVQFNGRTDNAQIHGDLWKYLNDKFCTSDIEQVFEQKFGEKEVYIFGEGYGAGIQKGGGYTQDKSFIVFDVQVNGVYLKYDDMKDLCGVFGVDVVPILLTGTIQDGIDYVEHSAYSNIGGGTQPLEGVVGRLKEEMFDRFGNRLIIKIKKVDFS